MHNNLHDLLVDIVTWLSLLFLSHKVECFIGIPGSHKTDNLTCETIYDNFTCENYRFSTDMQLPIIASGYLILVEKTVVNIIYTIYYTHNLIYIILR